MMRIPWRRPWLTESEISEREAERKADRKRRAEEHPELCSACWHPNSVHKVKDSGPPETIVCGVRRCRCLAVRSWAVFGGGIEP